MRTEEAFVDGYLRTKRLGYPTVACHTNEHVMCAACFEQHRREAVSQLRDVCCPVCPSVEMVRDTHYSNILLGAVYRRHPLRCRNNGCTFEGTLEKHPRHAAYCTGRLVLCPNAFGRRMCRWRDSLFRVEQHLTTRDADGNVCGQFMDLGNGQKTFYWGLNKRRPLSQSDEEYSEPISVAGLQSQAFKVDVPQGHLIFVSMMYDEDDGLFIYPMQYAYPNHEQYSIEIRLENVLSSSRAYKSRLEFSYCGAINSVPADCDEWTFMHRVQRRGTFLKLEPNQLDLINVEREEDLMACAWCIKIIKK